MAAQPLKEYAPALAPVCGGTVTLCRLFAYFLMPDQAAVFELVPHSNLSFQASVGAEFAGREGLSIYGTQFGATASPEVFVASGHPTHLTISRDANGHVIDWDFVATLDTLEYGAATQIHSTPDGDTWRTANGSLLGATHEAGVFYLTEQDAPSLFIVVGLALVALLARMLPTQTNGRDA